MTLPPRGTQKLVLVITRGLADQAEPLYALFLGDAMIFQQALFNAPSVVRAFITIFLTLQAEEEVKSIFVYIYRHVENLIHLDFAQILCNSHRNFSFPLCDSTGCEPKQFTLYIYNAKGEVVFT